MSSPVTIRSGVQADLRDLRDVFLTLHDHHRGLSAVPLTEPDDAAWQARLTTYERHFSAECALLYLACANDVVVGYLFVVLRGGSDDTFPLGAGHAEIYTLAVLPAFRRGGIGTRLLDGADEDLARRGVHDLSVAVMADNDAAIRFYRRRDLILGELVMYRLGRR